MTSIQPPALVPWKFPLLTLHPLARLVAQYSGALTTWAACRKKFRLSALPTQRWAADVGDGVGVGVGAGVGVGLGVGVGTGVGVAGTGVSVAAGESAALAPGPDVSAELAALASAPLVPAEALAPAGGVTKMVMGVGVEAEHAARTRHDAIKDAATSDCRPARDPISSPPLFQRTPDEPALRAIVDLPGGESQRDAAVRPARQASRPRS
jgi:hypothetical protein